MTPRILFYVQHLLGVGHVKRAAALARALCSEGAHVTVAMGGFPVPLADFGAADVVQLPPCRTADLSFKTLFDDQGKPVDESWWQARQDRLLKLGEETAPHVVLVEHYPFGRRAFRRELEPLLAQHASSARTVCSVRDVLVARDDAVKNGKIADMVLRRFDHVLVHGDAEVIPFEATFPPASRFAERIIYTGYITDEPPQAPAPAKPAPDGQTQIVVSTGGGAVGAHLLRAALDAASLPGLEHAHWRLLAGENLAQHVFDELQAGAPGNVVLERARADFAALLRAADLSVSQGGYNTVMDVISAGCRSLIVPFADSGESEQGFRAEHFARRGLLSVCPAEGLDGQVLAQAALAALAGPTPPGAAGLKLDGAVRAAKVIMQLAENG